jgi:hypothetical protein
MDLYEEFNGKLDDNFVRIQYGKGLDGEILPIFKYVTLSKVVPISRYTEQIKFTDHKIFDDDRVYYLLNHVITIRLLDLPELFFDRFRQNFIFERLPTTIQGLALLGARSIHNINRNQPTLRTFELQADLKDKNLKLPKDVQDVTLFFKKNFGGKLVGKPPQKLKSLTLVQEPRNKSFGRFMNPYLEFLKNTEIEYLNIEGNCAGRYLSIPEKVVHLRLLHSTGGPSYSNILKQSLPKLHKLKSLALCTHGTEVGSVCDIIEDYLGHHLDKLELAHFKLDRYMADKIVRLKLKTLILYNCRLRDSAMEMLLKADVAITLLDCE